MDSRVWLNKPLAQQALGMGRSLQLSSGFTGVFADGCVQRAKPLRGDVIGIWRSAGRFDV